ALLSSRTDRAARPRQRCQPRCWPARGRGGRRGRAVLRPGAATAEPAALESCHMQLAKLWQRLHGSATFTPKDRMPLWMLIYLGFLFLPAWAEIKARWFVPTVLSIPVFLALYLPSYYRGAKLGKTFGVALVGFALAPVNPYADIYLVYSAA